MAGLSRGGEGGGVGGGDNCIREVVVVVVVVGVGEQDTGRGSMMHSRIQFQTWRAC